MKKIISIPAGSNSESGWKNSLNFEDYVVMEHRFQGAEERGMMYIDDHLLFFVLEGHLTLFHGDQKFVVSKHEMTLLKKGTYVQFIKEGNIENELIYSEMMFTIHEDLIRSFLSTHEKILPKGTDGKLRAGVHLMTDCLITFTESLRSYFDDSSGVYLGQMKLKMTEMLYHLGIGNDSLFQELLQLKPSEIKSIREVIEQYYTVPLSLAALAQLSGRSLSSFKRDFKARYNMAPAAWIRKRRLERAKEMLESTKLSVAEICFSLGFENISHFSRIFKEYYGNIPTYFRGAN